MHAFAQPCQRLIGFPSNGSWQMLRSLMPEGLKRTPSVGTKEQLGTPRNVSKTLGDPCQWVATSFYLYVDMLPLGDELFLSIQVSGFFLFVFFFPTRQLTTRSVKRVVVASSTRVLHNLECTLCACCFWVAPCFNLYVDMLPLGDDFFVSIQVHPFFFF